MFYFEIGRGEGAYCVYAASLQCYQTLQARCGMWVFFRDTS